MLMENVAKAKRDAARWEKMDRGLATVYAVRAADAVKFGHTLGDVDKRIRALQTGCPVDLELLGHTLCDSITEGAIHSYLKPHCHLRGEWFRFDHPEVQEVIALIQAHQADKLLKMVAPEYFRNFIEPILPCVSIDKDECSKSALPQTSRRSARS